MKDIINKDYSINNFPKRLKRITKMFLVFSILGLILNIGITIVNITFIIIFIFVFYHYYKKDYRNFYVMFFFIIINIILVSTLLLNNTMSHIGKGLGEIVFLQEQGYTVVGFAVELIINICLGLILFIYWIIGIRGLQRFIRDNQIELKNDWYYNFFIKVLEFFKKI